MNDEPLSWLSFGALLTANLAGALLLLPAFAPIYFVDRIAIQVFVGVSALGIVLTSAICWPRMWRSRGASSFLLSLGAAYLPPIAGWAYSMRAAFSEGPALASLVELMGFSLSSGGLCTLPYWLPFGLLNFFVLRPSPVTPGRDAL